MKRIIKSLIIAVVLSACSNKVENEVRPALEEETIVDLSPEQQKNAEIETGIAEKKLISSTLKLTGKIDVPPQNMISVSIPLGGYLKSTKLLPGTHLTKGEVIAVFEDQQYIQLQQDYLSAKAKLEFATSEFKRQQELNQTKASSDKVLQQAQLEYELQKVTVSALAEKLKLINIDPSKLTEGLLSRSINIYSPIDGFVSKVNVNIGKYVNPTDVVFELINPTDIHLSLKVFEKDLEKLSIGQKLVAYNNQLYRKHPCEIILISKDLAEDRSAVVHCHFDDYDKSLVPGMYMNAEVEVQTNEVLAVKEDAVVSFLAKDYIFVERAKGRYEMIKVIKGESENGYTAISAEDGSDIAKFSIVTRGAYSLLMQLKNQTEE